MIKRRLAIRKSKKITVAIGDVFAVPLGGNRYGYIRAYNDPFFAIFDVISDELLPLEVVKKYSIKDDAFIVFDAIEKGEWPCIGHIPFENEEDAWPEPKKQIPPEWDPSVKFVVYKGQYLYPKQFSALFGDFDFDVLSPLLQFSADDTVEYILEHCTPISSN